MFPTRRLMVFPAPERTGGRIPRGNLNGCLNWFEFAPLPIPPKVRCN